MGEERIFKELDSIKKTLKDIVYELEKIKAKLHEIKPDPPIGRTLRPTAKGQ